ncbi:peptide-methionine (S)-S-oxide reductase [Leeuwenhoekiella marinoflava DSM 3653]|uniref:Peptide methionine sulfoxide reductase MsrA n=3 Tax=Leeuwenhoekiella marinoflava TaxID=988 RepID=A0A4Q0PIG0_9FLAO|nr:peptide-methionine (S)-S-oxide reductase [Leeuwenhoekiella marinoflava]SHF39816.1 peptide-methionine (S)-S-oxide reductase [Leeuwenhoekiella marinoflava DSM 3653]
MRLCSLLILTFFTTMSCKNTGPSAEDQKMAQLDPVQTEAVDGYERAYFASGCFWCVEAVFESVKGVKEAVSGYSGGTIKNPTYKQVSYGKTNHAEAVAVFYDPKVISFRNLVLVFFGSQDPTTLNRQGPDRGRQYRSIAFYQNSDQKKIIEDIIAELNETVYDDQIVTQVLPFQKFWQAEGYHQNYERNNPKDPYIQGVSIPRLNRFKKQFPELLKDNAH